MLCRLWEIVKKARLMFDWYECVIEILMLLFVTRHLMFTFNLIGKMSRFVIFNEKNECTVWTILFKIKKNVHHTDIYATSNLLNITNSNNDIFTMILYTYENIFHTNHYVA